MLAAMLSLAPCHGQEAGSGGGEMEFSAGWRFPMELQQGFSGEGTLYLGWLTLAAMHTLVPGHLRVGISTGPAVSGGRLLGLGGLRAAWRLHTFRTDFGSWGNLQLDLGHAWLTDGTGLVGGGPVLEAGERVLAGLKGYWSYSMESDSHPGHFLFTIGLNMFKAKPRPEDDDPFTP